MDPVHVPPDGGDACGPRLAGARVQTHTSESAFDLRAAAITASAGCLSAGSSFSMMCA
jgi:hypothetical protein